jgi:hypothetical protein
MRLRPARQAGPDCLCAAWQALSSDEAFVRTSKGVYALSCLAGVSQRPTARNPRSQKKVCTLTSLRLQPSSLTADICMNSFCSQRLTR